MSKINTNQGYKEPSLWSGRERAQGRLAEVFEVWYHSTFEDDICSCANGCGRFRSYLYMTQISENENLCATCNKDGEYCDICINCYNEPCRCNNEYI